MHWRPWGAQALADALSRNKPILLSIGYSACHWCHVMAHESFEDNDTADFMNWHFINIKVDREEHPDVDALYQGALALMGQAGGWPLTMFLTPKAEPFWGGTYFPPQPKHGMPSFREVLRGAGNAYAQEPDKVAHNVKNLKAALEKLNTGQAGASFSRAALDEAARQIFSLIDPAHGGIGTALKFPNLPALSFLWDAHIRHADENYRLAVVNSLTQMCQGGIYDHIGGGFARYSTDAEWLVPHFEKMLSDNALFISLLTEAWKETRHPLFGRRVDETVSWVLCEMRLNEGGTFAFAASLDADSKGEEGKFYVWDEKEIALALGDNADEFLRAYDVTKFGNWEGKNILNRLQLPDYASEKEEEGFARSLSVLRDIRAKREHPSQDEKVMADWNGAMIAALANAGFAFDRDVWLDAATSAFSFVQNNMMQKDGHLRRCWCRGKAQHAAVLDDYAQMIKAALVLFETTQDLAYLIQAKVWAKIVFDDYWDTKAGGYFMTKSAEMGLPLRPKSAQDSAMPSGNAVMASNLARLYAITGDRSYFDLGEKTVAAFSGEAVHHFFPLAGLMGASDMLSHPVTLTGDQDMAAKALRGLSWPALIRLPGEDGSAHLCIGQTCLAPIADAAALLAQLKAERSNTLRLAANDAGR